MAHTFFVLLNAVSGPAARMNTILVMKKLLHSLGLLFVLLSFVSCGGKDTIDIYGKISGKVTDVSTGEPLAAAQVTLIPSANTIQTSAEGVFAFSGLDEGQYTVSVQKTGYQANRKNVTVISGETTEVVVPLSVIPVN